MFWLLLFIMWRFAQLVTLIPVIGMLAYFVDIYNDSNKLTPDGILVLFIVSVLAAAWALATMMRLQSSKRSGSFIGLVDLLLVGAFIAAVYELRRISGASCKNFATNEYYYELNRPTAARKTCDMLKACFAFGIMNCIFFFFTSILAHLMRSHEHEVVVRETYTRRRSHGSRRGHATSGDSRRRSHSQHRYYV